MSEPMTCAGCGAADPPPGGGTDRRRACPGCRRRFDRLWTEHRHVATFVRRCGAAQEADDVVADVYLVAWRRLQRAPVEPDEARAWLCTVARNVLANVRRRSRRQSELGRLLVTVGDRRPEAAFTGRWIAAETFRSLTTSDRRLLWLAGTRRLSLAELGDEVGCSASAVAVRLTRARQRLDRAAGA